MILILCAIIVAAIMSRLLFRWADNSLSPLAFVLFLFLATGTGVSAIAYSIFGWQWIASEYKASIINREYKTSYTREEIFYASDVINTIRDLDRNRVEINGDIMQQRGKESSCQTNEK